MTLPMRICRQRAKWPKLPEVSCQFDGITIHLSNIMKTMIYTTTKTLINGIVQAGDTKDSILKTTTMTITNINRW